VIVKQNLKKALLITTITPTFHPLLNLCAMCLPCCTHTHTHTQFRKCKYKFSRTHIDGKHTHTHTQTTRSRARANTIRHTNTETHHTMFQNLDDNVLRHILQHHSCVCLIIPDSIERSNLILFTCSRLAEIPRRQEKDASESCHCFAFEFISFCARAVFPLSSSEGRLPY